MLPAFWMWVGKFRGYRRQLREYVVNMRVPGVSLGCSGEVFQGCFGSEMCHCHGACFLDVGGKFRGYGRQLREYVENMLEMCQCHGACFLDVGGGVSWVRETIKKISREYAGNVPVSWCLFVWMWVGDFVGTGDT
jgi:hypothetical protein